MAYIGPAPANSIIATSDIEDGAVTSAKLGGNIVTPGTLDVNGQELILDANANTSITADTDDQIDIKVAGADDFQITANTMSVLSGSTLNIDSGATIANSGTATGFGLTGVTTGSGNVTITSGNLIVASGNGVDFSATSDATGMTAELLDEYEEGQYIPTVTGSNSGNYGLTSGDDTLSYTRIGRVVHVQGQIQANADNSLDGYIKISLPFTAMAATSGGGHSYNGNFSMENFGTTIETPFTPTVIAGTANFAIYVAFAGASPDMVTHSNTDGTGNMLIGITYHAA